MYSHRSLSFFDGPENGRMVPLGPVKSRFRGGVGTDLYFSEEWGEDDAPRSASVLSLTHREAGGRFHFRAFNFYPRTSPTKECVSSMNLEVTRHSQTMRPRTSSSLALEPGNDQEDDEDEDNESFMSSVQVLPRQDSTGYDILTSGNHFPRYPSGLPPDHEIFVSSLQDVSGSWMDLATSPSAPTSPVMKKKEHQRRRKNYDQQDLQHQQQQYQRYQKLQHQRPKTPTPLQQQRPPPLPDRAPVSSFPSRNIADQTFRDRMKNRLSLSRKNSEGMESTVSLSALPSSSTHANNEKNSPPRQGGAPNYPSTWSIYSDADGRGSSPLYQTDVPKKASNHQQPPSPDFLDFQDTQQMTSQSANTNTSASVSFHDEDNPNFVYTNGFLTKPNTDFSQQDRMQDKTSQNNEKRGILSVPKKTRGFFRKKDGNNQTVAQYESTTRRVSDRKKTNRFFSFGSSSNSLDNKHQDKSSSNQNHTDFDVDDDSHMQCNCSNYHAHCFRGELVNSDMVTLQEQRTERLMASMRVEEVRGDDSNVPWNIFWVPTLSFHSHVHGAPLVEFSSLWPTLRELRNSLQTVLYNDAGMNLCTLAVTCGPVRVLRCLMELGFIRVDQLTHKSSGLLHLAVLARNEESVHYLMAAKVSPNTRDAAGLTADQVCFSPHLRKQLAPRYLVGKDVSKDRTLVRPSLQDRESIFRLATSPESFVDLQKKLQTLDFNVNTECDKNGDFLLHIACTKGLSQLPLLMALIKIQGADIELCNVQGMTALMMAAAEGNCVLCDVLICLFGANPNKPNSLCGRSALHYAVEGNHRKTVECLIRRGADVNMEDHSGLRPDDIPGGLSTTDDCCEVVQFNRNKRLEMLSDVVKKGEVAACQLLPYDMCVVDGEGHTLVMLAAIYNRAQSLHTLLTVSTSTINAQHSKTGMTALAIAAQMGNSHAAYVLLKYEACPTVADMNRNLPLHHAVLNNHDATVDVFLNFFPTTYQGLYNACRMCKKSSIHEKLYQAWEKRQYEIVTPKLLGCSLNGDAEELYQLLDEGDNINPKSGTGNWPLYLAVENGHLDVVQLICERGGDICKRHPTTGATALHVAAKMGHQSIVSYLLQFCHSPLHKRNKVNSSSTFPFSIPSTSSFFVRQSAGERSGNATSSDNSDGMPFRGRSVRTRRMDINAMDKNAKTALQLAAERGFSRIVEMLLNQGATTAILDSGGNLVMCSQYEGLRIMIESHRQRHTQEVIKCILLKSRKVLESLQDVWLPYFDHHLRTKDGQTPLMVAVRTGRIPVIKFLLASALYKATDGDEEDDLSDTDSGVLDPSHISPKEYSNGRDKFNFNHSGNFTDDFKENRSSGLNEEDSKPFTRHRVEQMLTDVNKPKGLAIYHNGMVSHVCAVNLTDGTTCLHQAVEGGDNLQVLELLLDTDLYPLNVQNKKGETVLHLACRLGRKKCVARLLESPGIDVNVRTLEGLLPDELSFQKSIYRMVEKARLISPPAAAIESGLVPSPPRSGSNRSPSLTDSTINFEQLHSRYEQLKMGGRGYVPKETRNEEDQDVLNSLGLSL